MIKVSLICNKNIVVSHCTGLVGLIVDEKDAELVPQQKMVRFIFNCDHCERMFPSHLSNILQATQKSNTRKYLPIHGLLDDVYLAFSAYFKPFNSSSFFEESYLLLLLPKLSSNIGDTILQLTLEFICSRISCSYNAGKINFITALFHGKQIQTVCVISRHRIQTIHDPKMHHSCINYSNQFKLCIKLYKKLQIELRFPEQMAGSCFFSRK